MTIAAPLRAAAPVRILQGIAMARAACFIVAVGVFLSTPPALPWVLALVAATNVVHLSARAAITAARPPLTLLLLNGATVLLVLAYVATS